MSESRFESSDAPRKRSKGLAILCKAVVAVIALAIVAAAATISIYWITHKPKAKRQSPGATAKLVHVQCVGAESFQVTVRAMGLVKPARSIDLTARVGGEVVEVSDRFLPGGRLEAGEVLLKIDPIDYELAVSEAEIKVDIAVADVENAAAEIVSCKTDLTQAQSELAIEMGAQSVAEQEYQLLGHKLSDVDRALVLRDPQRQMAQAVCDEAKAKVRQAEAAHAAALASQRKAQVALERARLDLKRTTVRVPLNAMILERQVDQGTQVAESGSLASLVGTDEYWVEAMIPVDDLRRIHIPGFNSETGSPVRVYYAAGWGQGVHRMGVVTCLLSDIEAESRMARVLLSVSDPLDLNADEDARRPLILGGYLRVEIEGQTLSNVFTLGRECLRNGRQVWVMGADDRLHIRDVGIAWTGPEYVCVSDGLAPGDRLVISDISTPVEGLALRVAADMASADAIAAGTSGSAKESN